MDKRSILAQSIASVLAIIGITYGGFSMTTMPDNVFRLYARTNALTSKKMNIYNSRHT